MKAKVGLKTSSKGHSYREYRLIESENMTLSDRWFVVGYPYSEEEGKMIRSRIEVKGDTIRERRKNAKILCDEMNARLAEGSTIHKEPKAKPVYHTGLSIQQAIEQFMTVKGGSLKRQSLITYQKNERVLAAWLAETKRSNSLLSSFSTADVHEYLDWLTVKRKLANKSVNKHRGYLSAFLRFFAKRGVLSDNPVRHSDSLPVVSGRHRAYSPEQRQAMRKYLTEGESRDDALWLFVSFMYFTLARPYEEIRRLKVGDLAEDCIIFRSDTVKTSRPKTVPIEPPLEALIQSMNLRSYPPNYYVFGKHERSRTNWRQAQDRQFFTRYDVRPGLVLAGESLLSDRHRRMTKALDFESGYDLYGWKHSGAVMLYKATKDIKLVQERCGHSTVATTEKYLRDLGVLFSNRNTGLMPDI